MLSEKTARELCDRMLDTMGPNWKGDIYFSDKGNGWYCYIECDFVRITPLLDKDGEVIRYRATIHAEGATFISGNRWWSVGDNPHGAVENALVAVMKDLNIIDAWRGFAGKRVSRVMNRSGLRRVKVYDIEVKRDEGDLDPYEAMVDNNKEAFLHTFCTNNHHPCAIIEMDDGKVDYVDARCIYFIT